MITLSYCQTNEVSVFRKNKVYFRVKQFGIMEYNLGGVQLNYGVGRMSLRLET